MVIDADSAARWTAVIAAAV